MNITTIHKLGMFHQKIRAATNSFEELQALQEYKKHMDEVEQEAFQSHKRWEMNHIGKTAD